MRIYKYIFVVLTCGASACSPHPSNERQSEKEIVPNFATESGLTKLEDAEVSVTKPEPVETGKNPPSSTPTPPTVPLRSAHYFITKLIINSKGGNDTSVVGNILALSCNAKGCLPTQEISIIGRDDKYPVQTRKGDKIKFTFKANNRYQLIDIQPKEALTHDEAKVSELVILLRE